MKISDMRQKEVINVSDGKRLGFVCDIGFDLNDGQIQTIIVPGERSGALFGRARDIAIPFASIRRIGEDIILVDYET